MVVRKKKFTPGTPAPRISNPYRIGITLAEIASATFPVKVIGSKPLPTAHCRPPDHEKEYQEPCSEDRHHHLYGQKPISPFSSVHRCRGAAVPSLRRAPSAGLTDRLGTVPYRGSSIPILPRASPAALSRPFVNLYCVSVGAVRETDLDPPCLLPYITTLRPSTLSFLPETQTRFGLCSPLPPHHAFTGFPSAASTGTQTSSNAQVNLIAHPSSDRRPDPAFPPSFPPSQRHHPWPSDLSHKFPCSFATKLTSSLGELEFNFVLLISRFLALFDYIQCIVHLLSCINHTPYARVDLTSRSAE
jgi:hypothetical protein